MTGLKLVKQALALLGYSENDGNMQLTQRVLNKALPIVNLVYNDISSMCGKKSQRIESLSEEIDLTDNAIDVLVCGVAGYIAQSEGDDNAQYFWSSEYQTRRTKLSKVITYEDILPITN